MKHQFAAFILAVALAAEGSARAEIVIDRSREGYVLFVPDTHVRRPLIVCLPGSGVQARSDLENWKSQARRHGFLLADVNFDYRRIPDGEAVENCQELIAFVVRASEKYGADPARLYIGGSSAGGMLAIALSLKFPGAYRGIGVLGGGRLREAWISEADLKNARGQRYYLIRGATDDVVSSDDHQKTLERLVQNGALSDYILYPKAGHSLPVHAYEEVGGWFRELDDASSLPADARKVRRPAFFLRKLRQVKRVFFSRRWGHAGATVINRIRQMH